MLSINILSINYCDRYAFSSEKARRELGYEPGSLDDGIRAALDWFARAGMIRAHVPERAR